MISQLRIQAMAQLARDSINVDSGNYPSQSLDWVKYLDKCSQIGFKCLGSGFFSAAFLDSESGKVLKVGYKKEDSGAAYAAFCRQNQGKAGIPTIHDIQRHQSCYTVVMERCVEFDDDEAAQEHKAAYSVASRIINNEYIKPFSHYSLKELNDLSETASDIVNFFKGVASFDLHSGNVMIENGRFVITDPVSFTKGRKDTVWDAIDNLDVVAMVRREVIMNKARKRRAYQAEKPQRRKERRRRKQDAEVISQQRRDEIRANDEARCHLIEMSCWTALNKRNIRCASALREMLKQHADAVRFGVNLPIDIVFDNKLQKTQQKEPKWSIFEDNKKRALNKVLSKTNEQFVRKEHKGFLAGRGGCLINLNDGLVEFPA